MITGFKVEINSGFLAGLIKLHFVGGGGGGGEMFRSSIRMAEK